MKTVLTCLTLLFVAPGALAGVWSHGGSSVVCRDPDGTIQSVQLLDSYEAENIWGLKLDRSTDDGVLLERAVERLSVHPWMQLRIGSGMLPYYSARYWYLSPDEYLRPINDVYPDRIKRGCEIEQLAACHAGQIMVDSILFPHLDRLDRATLTLHEVIYLIQKERHPELRDSRPTRHLVAQLISENPDEERIAKFSNEIAFPFEDGIYAAGECRVRLRQVMRSDVWTSYLQLDALGPDAACSGYGFRSGEIVKLMFDQEPGYFGNERVGFQLEGSPQMGCVEELIQHRRFCREN